MARGLLLVELDRPSLAASYLFESEFEANQLAHLRSAGLPATVLNSKP